MIYETLTSRSVVGISGENAMNFLHNLTTNDIKKYNYCYNYALSSQGRYLFDLFVFKISDTDFLIDINAEQVDLFKKHLMIYKLRSKIEISDLRDIYQVTYSKEKLEIDVLVSVRDPRYNELGFRSIVSIGEGGNDIRGIKTPELYLQDRYNFTIIDGYDDLIYDRSIPVEYGCEELNAVSYDKGCYIGQEVISRTKYQGVIRKKIFKISSEANISHIEKNTEINVSDKKIGVICSSYKNMGIGLIRLEEYSLLGNNVVTIKNIPVTLSIPPWRI